MKFTFDGDRLRPEQTLDEVRFFCAPFSCSQLVDPDVSICRLESMRTRKKSCSKLS